MSDLTPAPSRPRGTRCPTCGARVTSVASWCSLCFADLHPAPLASASPSPDAASASPLPDAASAGPVVPGPDRADADFAAEIVDGERVADQLLAELAVSSGTPGHGRFTLLSTATGRVVATFVGTVAATALGFALLALGGALL